MKTSGSYCMIMHKILLCLFGQLYLVCEVTTLLVDVDTSTLQNELTALKAQMASMNVQIATLQQTIKTLHNQLNASSVFAAKATALPHHAPVAFTAQLTRTIRNLGANQHVVFDHVVTNIGGAYSNSNGHFTAPVFGVYFFFLTATNIPGHSVSLTLMLNGVAKGFTLAHGTTSTAGQWETSTLSVVLVMKAGDQVWAQNERQYSPIEQLDGNYFSSLGGFLINQL